MSQNIETATLGGGCFWCVEAVFDAVEGVISATSGYSGGKKETADYKTVCSGTTEHAEVVQIKFDPSVITYAEILEMFWTAHDPTTLNRQGNDRGPQYRSVIFYHDEAQRQTAEASIQTVAPKMWDDPIVTQLAPLEAFYEAESYHHDYYAKVGDRNSYCTFVITPKVTKFRKKYSARLKKSAVG
ncbi:MAG: peptide-methionine (S)-S-oxide reductase MsrA [Bacteroidota bacterium]